MNDFLNGIGVVIGAIIVYTMPVITKWFKSKTKKKDFIKALSNNVAIQKNLDEIRIAMDADKVVIKEYHNGTSAYNGLPFNYCSMSYESCAQNIKSTLREFQNVPISYEANYILKLEKSSTGYITGGSNDKDDDTRIMFKAYDITRNYSFKIGKTIMDGVISVSYHDIDKELTKQEIEEVIVLVTRIKIIRDNIHKH